MNVKDILNRETYAINSIPLDNLYDEIVDVILNNTGRCIFVGVGKAGTVSKLVSEKFNSIGISSYCLDVINARHGDLGVIKQNDILISFSNSGITDELIELYDLIEKLYGEDFKKILITGTQYSKLSNRSNFILWTGSKEEMSKDKSIVLGHVPTLSTTRMSIIGDILVSLLIEKKEITVNEYLLYHSKGYISSMIKSLNI